MTDTVTRVTGFSPVSIPKFYIEKVNESLVFLYFNLYCFSSLHFFQEINEGRCLSCSFVIGVKMSHFDK